MIHLVTGGSGSGKSAYAEKICRKTGAPCLYLATMQIWDREDERRVEKHRKMREGKGFETMERPSDLEFLEIPDRYREGTILLECMSNLLVNEMYRDVPADSAEERILRGIARLASSCRSLVIVTDEIFSDGKRYDEETERYLRMLGALNGRIARMADRVTEVVFGIPVPVKTDTGERDV